MGFGGAGRPAATTLSDEGDRPNQTDEEHKLLHRKASKNLVFGRHYPTFGILSSF
jgi:hypothetical protein